MISVIIPVKGHRVVEKLLKELQGTKINRKFEILVIDSAPDALRDLRNKFKKVRWIDYDTSSKQSIPEQRNFGIKKAKGNIIAFIDADCVPEKDWLSNLTEPIVSGKEKITCGWVKSVRKYPMKWTIDHFHTSKYVLFAPTMNSAFSREVFDKIGLYDARFMYGGEDLDYCWRVIKAGYKIRYCSNAVVYHDWGDAKRNLSRMFGYGKANFLFFEKHFAEIIRKPGYLYGILAYPFFIAGLPIILVFPLYPLLILIPFLKTLFESKSLEYSFENMYFNFLYGFGFLAGNFSYVKSSLLG
ncbi:MAG TPA: glycosyltransferase [Candidatus Andersenbacteria bacterium]|nr:glycosyltransferase [Candidatus Andersenbacteria bacterium]